MNKLRVMEPNDIKHTTEVSTEAHRSRPRWQTYLVFSVLFAFLFLMAWGILYNQSSDLKVGSPAPAFSLETYDGSLVSLDDLKGRVVLINFWSSWCDPCDTEAPEIESAWQYFKTEDRIAFVGIAYADTQSGARRFIEDHQITFPNGADLGSEISNAYRVRAVPESFLIDPQGNLAAVKYGAFESEDEIISLIEDILE